MEYKKLFIFVEGGDDKSFFEKVVLPELEEKYDVIKLICYAKEKSERVKGYLRSINSMGADYILITDINNSPCITAKKEKIQKRFKGIDKNRIVVVIKEIESWYLAGLEEEILKKFKMHNIKNTDTITKEQFDRMIPRKFDSRIDFMAEILKNFSIETAKRKNSSFKYFMEKYDP